MLAIGIDKHTDLGVGIRLHDLRRIRQRLVLGIVQKSLPARDAPHDKIKNRLSRFLVKARENSLFMNPTGKWQDMNLGSKRNGIKLQLKALKQGFVRRAISRQRLVTHRARTVNHQVDDVVKRLTFATCVYSV